MAKGNRGIVALPPQGLSQDEGFSPYIQGRGTSRALDRIAEERQLAFAATAAEVTLAQVSSQAVGHIIQSAYREYVGGMRAILALRDETNGEEARLLATAGATHFIQQLLTNESKIAQAGVNKIGGILMKPLYPEPEQPGPTSRRLSLRERLLGRTEG